MEKAFEALLAQKVLFIEIPPERRYEKVEIRLVQGKMIISPLRLLAPPQVPAADTVEKLVKLPKLPKFGKSIKTTKAEPLVKNSKNHQAHAFPFVTNATIYRSWV